MENKNNKLDKILSIAIWILLMSLFVMSGSSGHRTKEEKIELLVNSAIIVSANVLSFVKAKRNNQIKGFGWEFASLFTILYVICFLAMLVGLLLNS